MILNIISEYGVGYIVDNLVRKYTIEEYEELKENTDSRLEFWHGLIVDMGDAGGYTI